MAITEFKLATTPLKDMLKNKEVMLLDVGTENLGKRIYRKIKTLPTAPAKSKEIPVKDFDKIADGIATPLDELGAMELTKNLSGEDGLEYLQARERAVSTLKNAQPDRVKEGLFGTEEQPVSDYDKQVFLRKAQIVDDPLNVIDFIKEGSLTPSDVEVVNTVYPNLSGYIKEAMISQYSQSNPNLSEAQQQALKTFVEIPDNMVAAAQSTYTPSEEKPNVPTNLNMNPPVPTPGQQQAIGVGVGS